jgi:hypothetical protein
MATETKKPENSRGIPAATFIEGVEAFVKNSGKDVDEIMKVWRLAPPRALPRLRERALSLAPRPRRS